MRKLLVVLVVGLVAVAACKSKKKLTTEQIEAENARTADSIAMAEAMEAAWAEAVDTTAWDGDYDYNWEPEVQGLPNYSPSKTRAIDIIHTKLDVKFDYEKQYMYGKAYITLKPYFYPASNIELDAKGFEVLGVFTVDKKNNTTPLQFEYENLKKLKINLGREYKATEEVTLFINYVARPNELPSDGGDFAKQDAAIKDAKGLYFINPKLKDKSKPRQIWTQGETEAASCWFPTFDSPNERFTQEIIMTVDTQYVTLSNGKLISSKVNKDGTRTDYWKQTLPHAPYLAMMAVGEFAIVKDKWRNIDVNYYVEKDYAKYARTIFGNTPKMIEFFSKKLGVDYPWEKYDQIVVRDFVSGAMENTGAVVHFDLLQHDDRMHIDQPYEEVVSHELFHHWFGDLVTTESWANVPLNESFATYGEYLWIEHAYSRADADEHIDEDLTQYLSEAEDKQVDLVRFNVEKPDDMFDAHSYQKGGRVLHMLRKYVGDDAFFKSLNLYLNQNKFKSVEMHQLRLAFEEVTGEDLNWFFNQWFYSAGHPVMDVTHNYDEEAGVYSIEVRQLQNGEGIPNVFKLPIKVDLYMQNGKRTEEIVIDESYEKIDFIVDEKPRWVNFDADKALLCKKTEIKDMAQWVAQINEGPLYMDRLEALKFSADIMAEDASQAMPFIQAGISDKFWGIRKEALDLIKANKIAKTDNNIAKRIAYIAENDKKASVRRAALDILGELKDKTYTPLFTKMVNDSSYFVVGEALAGLAQTDSAAAVRFAEAQYPTMKNAQMKGLYLYILGKYGSGDYMGWFTKEFEDNKKAEDIFLIASGLGAHMMNGDEDRVQKGLELLDGANSEGNWIMMFVMYGINKELNKKYLPIYNALSEQQGSLSAKDAERLTKITQILEKTGGLGGDDEEEEMDIEIEEGE
jgi:aminopeptidase N